MIDVDACLAKLTPAQFFIGLAILVAGAVLTAVALVLLLVMTNWNFMQWML
jgi:hypothetical protein